MMRALRSTVVTESYVTFMRSLPDASIDLIITDPPFGIRYQNNYTRDRHAVLMGDTAKFSYSTFAQEAYRVLKNNSAIYVFTRWSEYPAHFRELAEAGFDMKEPVIGQKRPSGTSDLHGTFQSNVDWVMFAHKNRFKFRPTTLLRNKRAGTVPNIGRAPVPTYKTRLPSGWFGPEYPWSSENSAFQRTSGCKHPTIKGQTFIEWLIRVSSNDGDAVLDPFVGSGTTAVAAAMTGRRYIVGDIEPSFVAMTRRRLKVAVQGM
jgi:site-specific DNA-methyltransferase (adenine-specific)